MPCHTPITVKHPTENRSIRVPCNKCGHCLKTKRDTWSARMALEAKQYNSNSFITLTYNDSSLPSKFCNISSRCLGGSLDSRDVTLFLKRLRKAIEPHKVRYYLCGEYGSRTFRPHYHLILFNSPVGSELGRYKTLADLILSCWDKGHITVSPVTPARFTYVAKYCIKPTFIHPDVVKPFSRMSRRPAIGSNYLTSSVMRWHRLDPSRRYLRIHGFKYPLPSAFKAKLYPSKVMNDLYVKNVLNPLLDEAEFKKIQSFYVSAPSGDYWKSYSESVEQASSLIIKNSTINDVL